MLSFVHALVYIHSFSLYLVSSYYELEPFLGTWDTPVSKTDTISAPVEKEVMDKEWVDYKHNKSLKCDILKGGKCYGEKQIELGEVRPGMTEWGKG